MQPKTEADPPLDSKQVTRIEGTHSGFLYQHLHAVAQLLTNSTEVGFLTVEYSEDVEVHDASSHTYIQLKHYADQLQPSDVAEALDRFTVLRSDHLAGVRQGAGFFALVSSSEASPSLEKQVSLQIWPADVRVATPLNGQLVGNVPAWRSLQQAVEWCVEKAAAIPFSKLDPETLVWKLTAFVLAVASGRIYNKEHRIPFSDLPRIREQMDLFADAVPPAPSPYRSQRAEPAVKTGARVRVVTGVSGSGKTAWISSVARHYPGLVAFARAPEGVADVPGWIVRNLAAHLLPVEEGALSAVFRPGLASEESLRLLDVYSSKEPVLLVVDNAHLLDARALAHCTQVTRTLDWILLGQPTPAVAELQSRIAVVGETMDGWDEKTIAVACYALGAAISPEVAIELRDLTGGVPLYVESTARAAVAHYSGSIEQLLNERRRGTHVVSLPQESLIAKDVLNALSPSARCLSAVLAFGKSQLTRTETSTVAQKVLALPPPQASACVRELVEWAVLRPGAGDALWLHDVFKPAAEFDRLGLDVEIRRRGLQALLSVLNERTDVSGDLDRALDIIRLMAELGDGAGVVDLVYGTIEWFREHSMDKDIELVLETVVDKPGLDPEFAFLGTDALCFIALSKGDEARATKYLARCESLAAAQASRKPDWEARQSVKRILLASVNKDKKAARAAYEECAYWADKGTEAFRVATYDYAMALRACGDNERALRLLNKLVKEYFKYFNISPGDLFRKNVPDLEPLFERILDADEIRHFADCLDVRARTASDLGVVVDLKAFSTLDAMWATKLYAFVGAFSSAMRAGVEAARIMRLLGTSTAAAEAVQFCETALVPNLKQERMIQWIVPVSLEYAQALALVGRLDDARKQLRGISVFVPSLPSTDQELVDRVTRWVETQAARNENQLHDGLVAVPVGLRRILRGEFDQYRVRRDGLMQAMVEEIAWFEREDKARIGVVIRDRTDNEYGWVVLENDGVGFSWSGPGEASLPDPQSAASALVRALAISS